ncbi:MAG TPA: sn-glycerol-3-phosphate ABC transporter ATP-binding protein UgpC [Conexibacter sp.]|jgi:multiple sugar transport system ATP-binding protein|nr:sn-glycerol-3-phosphate ABC transporter ATP-binding protein UgpC [Conexibacter sp.]
MKAIYLDSVTKRYANGVLAVDGVELAVEPGEFIVLVGPSGCGKTTLLRMLAGLESVSEGSIRLGEKDITHEHPRRRDIAMVFQDYALYPQMTVAENLRFALKLRKVPKATIDERVDHVARVLGLERLLDRRPGLLSGGQRQRVALGRAIVREPAAFLMDEPLSNLDAKLRVAMRAELARLHARLNVTTVYVTHDQVEAMTLGDRVVVMSEGRVQQVGPPGDIYSRPANVFVAAFMGSPPMNLVSATVEDGVAVLGPLRIPLGGHAAGASVVDVGIRPGALRLAAASEAGAFGVEVDVVEDLGDERLLGFRLMVPRARSADAVASDSMAQGDDRLIADEAGTPLVAKVPTGAPIAVGDVVQLALAGEVHVFDPATGDALGVLAPADRAVVGEKTS